MDGPVTRFEIAPIEVLHRVFDPFLFLCTVAHRESDRCRRGG